MKEGVYLYSCGSELGLLVVLNTYQDCYISKWEKSSISMTVYINIQGKKIRQRTDAIESVFESRVLTWISKF